MMTRLIRTAATAALLAASGGCLAYSFEDRSSTGQAVLAGTFDHLTPGTSMDWVAANLGQPTAKTVTGTNEVWRYTHENRTEHTDAILFVYIGRRSVDRHETYFVEFVDHVVKAKWRG